MYPPNRHPCLEQNSLPRPDLSRSFSLLFFSFFSLCPGCTRAHHSARVYIKFLRKARLMKETARSSAVPLCSAVARLERANVEVIKTAGQSFVSAINRFKFVTQGHAECFEKRNAREHPRETSQPLHELTMENRRNYRADRANEPCYHSVVPSTKMYRVFRVRCGTFRAFYPRRSILFRADKKTDSGDGE